MNNKTTDVKKIGIIGASGRMGQAIQGVLLDHPHFVYYAGYSRGGDSYQSPDTHKSKGCDSLQHIFTICDLIIDVSHGDCVPFVLKQANETPKPLLIGTTGWDEKKHQDMLKDIGQKAPVVIAPNTSIGAYLQRHIISYIAQLLGSTYDRDLLEIHHHHKQDAPSGTGQALLDVLTHRWPAYDQPCGAVPLYEGKGARPMPSVGLAVQRSGNACGQHDVMFSSIYEVITLSHKALDPKGFALGALHILTWLGVQTTPGIYSMDDVMATYFDQAKNFNTGPSPLKSLIPW